MTTQTSGLRRVAAAFLVVVLSAGTFSIPEAAARRLPPTDQTPIVSGKGRLGERLPLSFWTTRRLRNAVPMPLRVETRRAHPHADRRSDVPSGSIDPAPPALQSGASFRSNGDQRSFRELVLEAATQSTDPVPYRSYEVAEDYRTYPFSTFGKIFVVFDKKVHSCSGTAITSGNRSLVWSAAHCVYDTRSGWAEDLIFVPAYRDGEKPFGTFPVHDLFVPSGWIDHAGRADDQAAIVVDRNPSGDLLSDVTGTLGIEWNVEPETFRAFGYPGAPKNKYNGERLIVCESPHGGYKEEPFERSSVAMGCDMEFGASGGGWVGDSGRISSNVSNGRPNSKVMWGPYFDDVTAGLYMHAAEASVPEPPEPAETVTPRSLSLRLRRHLVARGRITAADDPETCAVGARVNIFRKTATGWRLLKRTVTNDSGAFRVKLRDRSGRYVARAPRLRFDDRSDCGRSVSVVRRHRHH